MGGREGGREGGSVCVSERASKGGKEEGVCVCVIVNLRSVSYNFNPC